MLQDNASGALNQWFRFRQ